jgi:hypothetical protein
MRYSLNFTELTPEELDIIIAAVAMSDAGGRVLDNLRIEVIR